MHCCHVPGGLHIQGLSGLQTMCQHSTNPVALQSPIGEGTSRLPGAQAGPEADLHLDSWNSFLPPSTNAPRVVVARVFPSSILSSVSFILVTSS